MKANRMIYMSRCQIKDRIRQYPVALLPIGATEQHGHHLPVGTDIFLAEKLSERVAEQTGALILPSLSFGYSWTWRDIEGTVSLNTQTFQQVLKECAASVERYGMKMLVFINGHDSNNTAMKYAVREISDLSSMKVMGIFYPGLKEVYKQYIETPMWEGMFHACEFETSLMLACKKDLVDMNRAKPEYPVKHKLYGMDNVLLGEISKSGVYGDPTLASFQKGEDMFKQFTQNTVEIIRYAYERHIENK